VATEAHVGAATSDRSQAGLDAGSHIGRVCAANELGQLLFDRRDPNRRTSIL